MCWYGMDQIAKYVVRMLYAYRTAILVGQFIQYFYNYSEFLMV